jgi:hypothetical protein
MEGQSFKDVGKRFRISVSAVEKLVAGALRSLSEHLKEAERAQRLASRTNARRSSAMGPRRRLRRNDSSDDQAAQI